MDICTTATVRPDVLRQTLESFKRFVFGSFATHRHILHVDNIGSHLSTVGTVFDVSREYFHPRYEYRFSDQPSFPVAFRWCWQRVESPQFFWLEDDWEAFAPVDFDGMVATMQAQPDLAVLRLPLWDATDTCRQWNKKLIDYHDGYFEIPENLRGTIGFSGNPSLVNTRFAREALEFLHVHGDPEKQIKGGVAGMAALFPRWRFGVWQRPNTGAVVRDIGRAWRAVHGFKKGNRSGCDWTSESSGLPETTLRP
jgi:hypothetical protein